jgi:cytochrome c biogenesis protein CcdA
MMREQRRIPVYLSLATLPVLLLVLGVLGYLAFLSFVKGVLAPQQFAAYGLVLTTIAAATASFFSPCSFTVLPSYLAFAGSAANGSTGARFRHVFWKGLVAALGVATAVGLLGLLIGALGTGIGPGLSIAAENPNAGSRALRIAIGVFVASLGLVHLLNLSHRIPLLGRISTWAIRAEGEGGPSIRSVYAYGVGYVLVGIG